MRGFLPQPRFVHVISALELTSVGTAFSFARYKKHSALAPPGPNESKFFDSQWPATAVLRVDLFSVQPRPRRMGSSLKIPPDFPIRRSVCSLLFPPLEPSPGDGCTSANLSCSTAIATYPPLASCLRPNPVGVRSPTLLDFASNRQSQIPPKKKRLKRLYGPPSRRVRVRHPFCRRIDSLLFLPGNAYIPFAIVAR